MDLKILISFLFLSTQFLTMSCEYMEVKNLWDQRKKICGNNSITALAESLKNKAQELQTTVSKHTKRIDKIVVNYDDFRCCLKKTIVKDLKTKETQKKCMEQVLLCMLSAQKEPCSLKTLDYINMAFTRTWMFLSSMAFLYALLVILMIGYNIQLRLYDREARRLENDDPENI